MGRPIHSLSRTALRILIAWLLAFQPMVTAHAAAAMAGQAQLAMELCRGVPLPDDGAPVEGIPAGADHSAECCLACAPTPAAPPLAGAEIPPPAGSAEVRAPRTETRFVETAGLGPQSARAPPL